MKPPSGVSAFNTAVASGYQPANKNKRVIAFFIDVLISGAASKFLGVALLNHLHLKFPGVNLLINYFFHPLTLIQHKTSGLFSIQRAQEEIVTQRIQQMKKSGREKLIEI